MSTKEKTRAFHAVTHAALALVLVGACAGSPTMTPAGARASCVADADCVVTSSGGCCACCESSPHAVPALAFSQQQHQCAKRECAACDPNIECAKTERAESFVARCKEGTCAAVRRQ